MSVEPKTYIPKADPYDKSLSASPSKVRRRDARPDGDTYDTYTKEDWLTFLREYCLPTLEEKFEAGGVDHPLAVLRMTMPPPRPSEGEDESSESDDDGFTPGSQFDELCSELKLTIAEKLSLQAGLQQFFKHRRKVKKECEMRKKSFNNLRAIHILKPDIAKFNWDADQRVTLSFALLGTSGAGKSALSRRLVFDEFDATCKSTIGMDVNELYVAADPEVKELPIAHVRLWDTSGQERFRCTLSPQYYRGKDAFIFVYDVCKKESFDRIQEWHNDMEERVDKEEVVRVLVGNKTDLLFDQTKFTTEDTGRIREKAADLAARLGMTLFEVSCKSGQNVVDMVVETVKQVFDHRDRAKRTVLGSKRKKSKIQSVDLEKTLTPKDSKPLPSAGSGGCC